MRFLTALVLACGCGGSPPPVGEAMLTLGQLDGSFLPYVDGQDVTLVAGAQGGFHVWMSYQLDHTGEAILERTAHRVSDGAPAQPLPMFMCPAPVGISVIDQPIEYELRFSDDTGEIARGSVRLVPHCPADQLEFCQRICSG
jgi:hypothetical protein